MLVNNLKKIKHFHFTGKKKPFTLQKTSSDNFFMVYNLISQYFRFCIAKTCFTYHFKT